MLLLFQVTPSHSVASGNSGSQSEQIKSSSSNICSMKPLYTQTLQTPNVKVMCIAAIGRHFFMEYGERERELERKRERERERESPQIVLSYYCFFLSASDGCNELYVGLTDCSVVLYRWAEEGRSLQSMKSFKLPGQVQMHY